MRDGKLPQDMIRRMGFWKAEEYQKFTFPASEYKPGGTLWDEYYHSWIPIVRVKEMIFSCGRSGWTLESLKLLKRLVWRHNILTEDVESLSICVISLHSLIHLTDSSPVNYWCFLFERAVHHYVEKLSNKKHIEKMFSNAESKRELLKLLVYQPAVSSAACKHRIFLEVCQQQVCAIM